MTWRNGQLASWLDDRRPQAHRDPVHRHRARLLLAGGVIALLIRAQLATPNEDFLTKNAYNEPLTMHGTTMIFLVIVPIFAGFGNYLVPLMIGARDMAFPRLNALSYWLYLFGGIVLYASWFAKGGPAHAGWTLYPPLSERSQPGNGDDHGILALHILAIASLIGAINFIVTIHNMRTAGCRGCASRSSSGRSTLRGAAPRRAAGDRRRADAAAARPPGRHALLPPERGRERESSTSTSSGSSGTPRSTSWSCPRWG